MGKRLEYLALASVLLVVMGQLEAQTTGSVAGRVTITLSLGQPQYGACGEVSLNGFVQASSGQIAFLAWDWGDGSTDRSWFPAAHRYAKNGHYDVRVTAMAFSCDTGSKPESVTAVSAISVINAGAFGCDPLGQPSSFRLKPYNLHLAPGGPTTGQLHVLDNFGREVTSRLSFDGFDRTLISVSPTGLVTVLRGESDSEIGTWIRAAVDGVYAANTCVVRVLSRDYGVSFVERGSGKGILYSPTVIGGEDIDRYVSQYEIPAVNDYVYRAQISLIGTAPFGGTEQIWEVDFGESEGARVCGISGNPIRLGWNIRGDARQNCFLVPFTLPRSPQWFVFYHELGHGTTGAASVFGGSLGPVPAYSEGLASYIAITSMKQVVDNPAVFPLPTDSSRTIREDYVRNRDRFVSNLGSWVGAGAEFSTLNPDHVDGILLTHEAEAPGCFATRFFNIFREENPEARLCLLPQIVNDNQRHTFFAAACSVAAGRDLRDTFISTYHFPLDAAFYANAYAALSALSPPSAVTLAQPADGAASVEQPARLRWQAAAGAVSYDLYLGPTSPPSLYAPALLPTERAAAHLAAGTQYFWKVVAHHPCTGNLESPTWSFTPATEPPRFRRHLTHR